MRKYKLSGIITACLFFVLALIGLLNVFAGKIDLSYMRYGNFGNLFVPLFMIAVPALIAFSVLFNIPIFGAIGGAMAIAFYLYRLLFCISSFMDNVRMTFMSYGVASLDILFCLLSFTFVFLIFLIRTLPDSMDISFFGFAIAAAVQKLISLVFSFVFSCVMSLRSFKSISKFSFFYPQIKLAGSKSYHLMVKGGNFLAQDIVLVLALFMMAIWLKREKRVN